MFKKKLLHKQLTQDKRTSQSLDPVSTPMNNLIEEAKHIQ
jgi:hypothetical protein